MCIDKNRINCSESNIEPIELPVLYRDDAIVAVAKPAGLLVHRSPIDKRETRFALQEVRNLVGQHVYPIHRLDRPTYGVLVFALSSEIAAMIACQWEQKRITKRYLALVRGYVHGSGMIDYALTYRMDKCADRDRIKPVPPQAAHTYYQSLANYELPWKNKRHNSSRFTLLELTPETGRKHQLRRHLVHLRHPILGDTTHGDGNQNKMLREFENYRQLALNCIHIGFTHPVTGRRVDIHAPIDKETQRLLQSWEKYKVDCIRGKK